MSSEGAPLAVFGGATTPVQWSNTFDWVFGNPFQSVNHYTPESQRVLPIEDDRPIFVHNDSDRVLTHARIRKDALALAAGLKGLGLDPNELYKLPRTPACEQPEIAPVVLIQLSNCLPIAPIVMGTFASGLTATLVSPALTSAEIGWILQNSRPRVIITTTACLAAMREALAAQKDAAYFSKVPIYTVDAMNDTYPEPQLTPLKLAPGVSDWKDLLKPTSDAAHPLTTPAAATRTAVILWSSGTSGRSKGVLLTHNALNFCIASLWYDSDYYRGQIQRWLGYVPFYHTFGLCNVLLLSIATGSSVYVMHAFKLDTVLKTVQQKKITYFHMAPPVAVMLAKSDVVEEYAKRDAEGKNAFHSVSAGVTGGAPLGHEIVVEVYRRLGFRVRLGYGLSETGSTTLQDGIHEEHLHDQAGDSGRPHWGVEVMIAAKDEAFDGGVTRPGVVGEDGEILIRCPGLMSAYLPANGLDSSPNPDMTTTIGALTADGWFRTGDVGVFDARGRLRITDCLKELIKVRAYQVAPAELEALLCSSDHVADAGVIGIYDNSEATEWPRAFVVARQQSKSPEELVALALELRQLVEEKSAKYKWLRGGIVFVEQVPKSPSGKILRRVLKNGGAKGFEVQLYEKKKRNNVGAKL